jgi:hypothetical protein
MADDEKPAKPAEPSRIEAPMIFIRGGTTTGAHDNMMAKQRADTDKRRAEQDAQFEATRRDPLSARMHSMKLGGQDHPKVVLAIKHPKDNLFLDWIVCEVIQHGPEELILNMACPQCHAKNPGHEPDFKIHQSNRKWWLDPNPPKWMRDVGADRIWLNPRDQSTVVVAGSVTTEDWIRCPGLGCPWVFKIDDSVVHTK